MVINDLDVNDNKYDNDDNDDDDDDDDDDDAGNMFTRELRGITLINGRDGEVASGSCKKIIVTIMIIIAHLD